MLIEATTQTTLGNVYILTEDDDLHVGASVTLRSTYSDPETHTGADAIIAWTGTHRITVDGTVYGEDEAINLVGCVTAQTVVVSATGKLYGGGDGVVTDADGVILDGVGTTLTNAGLIHAWGSAASVIVPDAGAISISNSGTMYGRVSGVWHKFGNGVLNFTNTGRVESPNASYLGGESADNVTNSGQMIGLIDLGGGNDLYDGRLGRITGSVLGGAGNDSFRAGNSVDVFDGGDGYDTLNLSHLTTALRINLTTPSANSGAAVIGDSYSGIERIMTGSGADHLTGNGGANRFDSGAGNATLLGGTGDDVLSGGAGKDYLTGGTGADQFVFLTNAGNGDVIYDFNSAEDRIVLDGAAFGYGTATGALSAADFVISTKSNAARDASDHFIFRTTDATLWYDADGYGLRAPVMIADLQAGATLTAAGILLI